ncbi:TPA: hypothetical protein ENS27_16825 [bacterium]|nr:hypothetical protein [bacterium]
MGNKITFTSKYLNNGHLSIPKELVNTLALRRGSKIRVVIEASKFAKTDFIKLFGIWSNKSEEEIKIYKDILEERKRFGRGEIRI